MTRDGGAVFHPTTFGKYFLTRRIAVGGMAEVFAAKLYGADGFEKDLVIKQILPQYARDPEFVQSFVAEAKIAVSLTHANIVSIYELGRVDGTYFIAMEYVQGQDVFALLEAARRHDDPLNAGLALLIVEEVCRGLDYAHRKAGPDGLPLGLVHRDLNPRNVLVSRDGDVKILDFGIAKTGHKSAAMPKTRAGVVKGTTGYMSPEQATGQMVDHRTDLYQAGLLLHECLTGTALFWRPEDHVTRELMRRHEIVPPSEAVAGLPSDVDDIVLRALRIRPEARFQTAADLASAIARVRAILFPEANHRTLGAWVVRLLERDRAAARALEDEIPETADFSEVISQAIEQSIVGQVETIATRTPGKMLPTPKRPRTGSQPLDTHTITGDLVPLGATPAPVAPAAVFAGTPISGDYPPTSLPGISSDRAELLPPNAFDTALDREAGSLEGPRLPPIRRASSMGSNTRVMLAAGFAVVLLGLLFALPWIVGGDSTEPARADPAPNAEAAQANGNREKITGESRLAEREALADRREPAEPRLASSRVDFGARPCNSRVSVNGQLLSRPTPIFEYSLPPGSYRVVMVGEGCTPENAPGALEPRKPRLTRTFRVEQGARLKVMADFDRGKILVRRSAE